MTLSSWLANETRTHSQASCMYEARISEQRNFSCQECVVEFYTANERARGRESVGAENRINWYIFCHRSSNSIVFGRLKSFSIYLSRWWWFSFLFFFRKKRTQHILNWPSHTHTLIHIETVNFSEGSSFDLENLLKITTKVFQLFCQPSKTREREREKKFFSTSRNRRVEKSP